jgi:hypothetical protein
MMHYYGQNHETKNSQSIRKKMYYHPSMIKIIKADGTVKYQKQTISDAVKIIKKGAIKHWRTR